MIERAKVDWMKGKVEQAFNSTLADIYKAFKIDSGDISPDSVIKWEQLVNQCTYLFKDLVEDNGGITRIKLINDNIYQEVWNTGGHCMVCERAVLTVNYDIYYILLSDEGFQVSKYSILDEHFNDHDDQLINNSLWSFNPFAFHDEEEGRQSEINEIEDSGLLDIYNEMKIYYKANA